MSRAAAPAAASATLGTPAPAASAPGAAAGALGAGGAADSPLSVRRLSLAEAVAAHVQDGDCVWIGNFGSQLFAVARELIAHERRDLHVVVASGGILLDQLLAAGVVGTATFGHCWSPVGPQPTRSFRRAWEQGSDVRWHELSIGALTAALWAGAQGVPFAPVALDARTGYVAGTWSAGAIDRASSPFGEATVVRALVPDVAFVHAVAADAHGNAWLGAPAGDAPLAAQAARSVVVVSEEWAGAAVANRGADVADRGAHAADNGANAASRGADGHAATGPGPTLPGVLVDTVVVEPGAAAPDGVAGRYPRDVAAYLAYGGSGK